MQTMGLSAAELLAYHRALHDPAHTFRVSVSVLDLAGQTLTSISPTVLDGQVIVDIDADVTRTLTLTFLDPKHQLNFDSDSPDDGALYADRLVRVHYSVRVPELDRHVSAVVFTGPATKLDRAGGEVSIEAAGMEKLALANTWRPLTIKKGAKKVDAIRTILRDRAGETRFALPEIPTRMPTTLSLDRLSQPWLPARRLANSLDRQLFYPGTGVCTMRRWPARPLFTFATGDGGNVVGAPSISHVMDDFANVVEVIGAKPKGKKEHVRFVATAPATHPLSPQRLGRNGTPRFIVKRVEDDHIRSTAEARRRATRLLDDSLRETVEVTFDAMPMPHLDPGDLCQLRTRDAHATFRLRKFSIPLGTEGDPVMPVGYLKPTQIRKQRIR